MFRYTERILIVSFLGLTAVGYFGFADTIVNMLIAITLSSVIKVRKMKIYEEPICNISNTVIILLEIKLLEYNTPTLDAKKRGPFTIVRVFTNGTVRLQIAAHVQETFNIRKIWPYKGQ